MKVPSSKQEADNLKKIHEKFEEIETLLFEMSLQAQKQILDFHHEGYTLQHCTRWGLQASEELLREVGKIDGEKQMNDKDYKTPKICTFL